MLATGRAPDPNNLEFDASVMQRQSRISSAPVERVTALRALGSVVRALSHFTIKSPVYNRSAKHCRNSISSEAGDSNKVTFKLVTHEKCE
jgi:hypothetical protein